MRVVILKRLLYFEYLDTSVTLINDSLLQAKLAFLKAPFDSGKISLFKDNLLRIKFNLMGFHIHICNCQKK